MCANIILILYTIYFPKIKEVWQRKSSTRNIVAWLYVFIYQKRKRSLALLGRFVDVDESGIYNGINKMFILLILF